MLQDVALPRAAAYKRSVYKLAKGRVKRPKAV
jgi:hypothetical protein